VTGAAIVFVGGVVTGGFTLGAPGSSSVGAVSGVSTFEWCSSACCSSGTTLAKSSAGAIASLSVGKFRLRDLNTAAELDSNMVGLGFLRRFRVTFDFPEAKLHLEPGKSLRVYTDGLRGLDYLPLELA